MRKEPIRVTLRNGRQLVLKQDEIRGAMPNPWRSGTVIWLKDDRRCEVLECYHSLFVR